MAKSVRMLMAALVLVQDISWISSWSALPENLQPHRELVDTSSVLFICPECSDWDAGKDTAENRPHGVANYHCHYRPACNLELLGRKHASILQ